MATTIPDLCAIHTVASTHPDHGGTSRSVPALCDALADANVRTILLSAASPEQQDLSRKAGVALHHLLREPARFRSLQLGQVFRRGLRTTIKQLQSSDFTTKSMILHDHGVWLSSNSATASFARSTGITRIVAPRGMLSPWSMNHGRLKKQTAWHLYQGRNLRAADALHATSELEAEELRNLGLNQPIGIVPNGTELPPLPVTCGQPRNESKQMLFLSRIHPKKGLEILLKAWSLVPEMKSWKLDIVGPDEGGYSKTINALIDSLGLTQSIRICKPVTDQQKWTYFQKADVFVLPTFSENFGIVVAEALACGTPVLTTTGTPWSIVNKHQCGWCVSPDTESLRLTLKNISETSEKDRQLMGLRGQDLIRESFSWQAAAEKMVKFYHWIKFSSHQPDFVI